ncbi:uncharacterized protein LOC129052825 [Pongo abelii]|uniref:uncharacterized protein LOC129052825 n=1 Tax=Pongo abelii TaxID=9601 RepID=UPI0023E8179A|nr:uncharacterized protein LOC129052825 [Pongo abelii]
MMPANLRGSPKAQDVILLLVIQSPRALLLTGDECCQGWVLSLKAAGLLLFQGQEPGHSAPVKYFGKPARRKRVAQRRPGNGAGAPLFSDGGAARERRSSLPRRWRPGAEVLVKCGRQAEAHLTSQAGPPQGRGTPHFPEGVAARRTRSSLPRRCGSQADALLTSQKVWQPGGRAPHFPEGVAARRTRSSLPRRCGSQADALLTSQKVWQPGGRAPHFTDSWAAGHRRSSLARRIQATYHEKVHAAMQGDSLKEGLRNQSPWLTDSAELRVSSNLPAN